MAFRDDFSDQVFKMGRIVHGQPSSAPVRSMFREAVRQVGRADSPNAFHQAADYAYSIGSATGEAVRFGLTRAPMIARIAGASNSIGMGLSVLGFLYSYGSNRGSWEPSIPPDLYPRDTRVLQLQVRGDSFEALRAAKLALSQGGTYHDVFMRVSLQLGFPVSFSYSDFQRVLASNNLVSSYRSTHPDSHIIDSYRSGDIGGVATDVGIIDGLKDSLEDVLSEEAVFCMRTADDRKPFSDLELREVIRAIAHGVFVHDTVPFFSLHFNDDGVLYPVVHPAYKNTIVGKVISLLDYYMKCYLNGGFFTEEFLSSWHNTQNTDRAYLKANMRDFKKYCKEQKLDYVSLREVMSLKKIANVEAKSGSSEMLFQSSFRIIAQQKKLEKHGNTFVINPDFRVEFTIEPSAEYKESIDKYLSIHGKHPEDYIKIKDEYQRMANTIKQEMPKLPFLRDYFQMLGIMSFFSYYFTTLKNMGKAPVLPPSSAVKEYKVPKAFPPIPVRYYKHQPVNINFKTIFDRLLSKNSTEFPQWIIRALDNSAVSFPAKMDADLKQIIHDYLRSQLPPEVVIEEDDFAFNNLKSSLFAALLNHKIRATLAAVHNEINDKIIEISNRLKRIKGKDSPAYPVLEGRSLKEKVELLKKYIENALVQMEIKYSFEFSEEELKIVSQKKLEAKTQLDANEQSSLNAFAKHLADKIPAHQEHHYQISGKSVAVFREEKNKEIRADYAKKRSELPALISELMSNAILTGQLAQMNDVLANPINHIEFKGDERLKAQIPYSVLECIGTSDAGDDLKIVGGCGVALPKLTPKAIVNSKELVGAIMPIVHATSAEAFNSIRVSEKNYAIFKLPIENKPSYSKVDHAELASSVVKEEKISKMGEKELKALSGFIADILEEKKEEDKKLIKDFNALAQDTSGQTLTHYAASYNSKVGNGWLLQKTCKGTADAMLAKDEHGNLPIHVAALNGNIEAIDYIVRSVPGNFEAKNNSGLTPLMLAAETGNVAAVQQLLKLGANPNHRLPNGLFGLYLAIQANSPQTALNIIQHDKTSLNFILNTGSSPLHLAIEMKQESLAIDLIRAGANLSLKLKKDGFLPLHLAAEMGLTKVCKEILARTRDHNAVIVGGKTALHIAAEKGHVATLQELLESRSVNPNAQTSEGETPIMTALRHGQTDAALCLADRARVNIVNARNETASLIAAKHAQLQVADLLSEKGEDALLADSAGDNYAYYLLRTGELLRYKAITEAKRLTPESKFQDKTALEIAMQHGHGLLFSSLKSECKDVNSILYSDQLKFALKTDDVGYLKKLSLNKDWSPRYKIFEGKPILEKNLAYIAAEEGSAECLQWLLSIYDTLKDKKDLIGYTPNKHHLLYAAIKSGDERIIDMVLAHCDNINILVSKNLYASELAVKFGFIHLLKVLHRRGADFSLVSDEFNQTAFNFAVYADDYVLLEELFELTPKEKWPHDIYSVALKKNSKKCLDVLYKNQINAVDRPRAIDAEVLHSASTNNNIAEIQKLLSAGVKPYEAKHMEYHPLYVASSKGYLEASKLLIEYSDLNSQVASLEIAIKNNHIDLVLLFADKKVFSRLTPPQLEECVGLAKTNKYILAALRGERAEYDRDKIAMIVALQSSDHRTFLRLINQGLSVSKTLFRYKNIEQPLLHCVVDEEAAWAMPMLSKYVDPLEKSPAGYSVVQEMLLSYEAESKHDDMTSPFQFLKKYFATSYVFGGDSVLYNMKTPDGISFSDLAVLKKHPDAFDFFMSESEGDRLLHSLVKLNDLEQVKKLFTPPRSSKINVNSLNEKRQSPLMIAASAGHVKMVEFLLTKGADPELIDFEQDTALHYAVNSNKIEVALQLASITKKRNQVNRSGHTPFHRAVISGSLPLVKVFRELGCDINVIDQHGLTAMHLAALQDNPEIIYHLASEMNVNSIQKPLNEKEAKNCTCHSPLHLAALHGKASAFAALIISGADLLQENFVKKTPLEYAAMSNNSDIWDFILNLDLINQASYQSRLLLASAAGENIDAMIDLLALNCNINAIDNNGLNALHHACIHEKFRSLSLLIENGIEVNAADSNGNTAFHHAAQQGFVSGLRQLSLAKCNINAKNEKGQTALHLACEVKHFPAIIQLLKSGVNVNAFDKNGFSPFHVALKNSDWRTVNLFHSWGITRISSMPADVRGAYAKFLELQNDLDFSEDNANPDILKIIATYAPRPESILKQSFFKSNSKLNHSAYEGKIDDVKQSISKSRGSINIPDDQGYTALNYASSRGKVEIVKYLIEEKADVNLPDKEYGNTPLIWAINGGFLNIVTLLLAVEVDPNIKSKNGDSALIVAVKLGREDMVAKLLAAGAIWDISDGTGKTPLEYANANKNTAIITLLDQFREKSSLLRR